MRKAVVGISANFFLINDQYPAQAAGNMNIQAIAEVVGAVPVIIPSMPEYVTVDEIMQVCDGFLFTGGRPNVHPGEYGHEETEAHGEFDRGRDGVTLPLIRACVEAGQPVLGLCRGFQEFNVAMGGTLHPEIRDLPGRMNHRMPPDGTIEEKFALRHQVRLVEGSPFISIFGSNEVTVNSLHGQGISRLADSFEVEAVSPDGLIEGIRLKNDPGFTVGVQWHAEWEPENHTLSRRLFESFGDVARKRARQRSDKPRQVMV